MLPNPGNAFAQQKEARRLKQTERHLAGDDSAGLDHFSDPLVEVQDKAIDSAIDDTIRTTTLEVPTTKQDNPSTAGTTMAALLGPETEQEKLGRMIVQQQRESMERKISRKNSRKNRRRSTSSSGTTVRHPSAMPPPLFRTKMEKVRNIFKRTEKAALVSTGFEKPLPAISSAEAAHAQAHTGGIFIPGAYIPSPASFQGGVPMRDSLAQGEYGAIPFNPQAHAFYPDQYAQAHASYAERGWPLPSSGNTHRHLSAQSFETNPSQYLHTGNQGMIYSSHLLTPTRAGDYAAFGHPKVVHPPSMMSMAASFVDPQSPINVQASQRGSTLGVVPEVQETRELQTARAHEVENLYNRGSYDSQSVPNLPPFPDATTTSAPRIPRSHSAPNLHTSRLADDPAAYPRRASTGTNLVFEPFSASIIAPVAPRAPAVATAPMLREIYARLRADLASIRDDIYSRISRSRRAVQSDLVVIHEQIKDAGRDAELAYLRSRVHAVDARTQRIEDKLDAIIDGMRLSGVQRMERVMQQHPGASVRGVSGRLAAPGPHMPWGT